MTWTLILRSSYGVPATLTHYANTPPRFIVHGGYVYERLCSGAGPQTVEYIQSIDVAWL